MKTKEAVLLYLQEHTGEPISGEIKDIHYLRTMMFYLNNKSPKNLFNSIIQSIGLFKQWKVLLQRMI